MKEKGSHFASSVAYALAAHALLFLFFAWIVTRNNLQVDASRVGLVEVQFSGADGEPGGGAPGSAGSPGRQLPKERPSAPVTARPVTPQPAPANTLAVAQSALSVAHTTAGAPPASGSAPGAEASASAGAGGSGAAGSEGSGTGPGSGSPGGPLATIADIDPVPLRPIAASYPASAKRLGQQGLVKVRADVDAQGLVVADQIGVSSGFASLDNAALDAVKNTRFLPAMKNGKSVASTILIPIRFTLSEN